MILILRDHQWLGLGDQTIEGIVGHVVAVGHTLAGYYRGIYAGIDSAFHDDEEITIVKMSGSAEVKFCATKVARSLPSLTESDPHSPSPVACREQLPEATTPSQAQHSDERPATIRRHKKKPDDTQLQLF